MFSLIYVKVTRPKHRTLIQQLTDLYSNVYFLKDKVIKPDTFSIYMLQEAYDVGVKNIKEMLSYPMILPEKILMRSENCTNPQLGKICSTKV